MKITTLSKVAIFTALCAAGGLIHAQQALEGVEPVVPVGPPAVPVAPVGPPTIPVAPVEKIEGVETVTVTTDRGPVVVVSFDGILACCRAPFSGDGRLGFLEIIDWVY